MKQNKKYTFFYSVINKNALSKDRYMQQVYQFVFKETVWRTLSKGATRSFQITTNFPKNE